MQLTNRKASVLNIIFAAINQIAVLVYGLLIPNMILNTFGAELHGYTSTVNTIMSYIGVLNAGLSPAAVQALYKPLAEKDNHKLSEVLNAVNKFYIKTGCLFTIAVFSCAFILPFIIGEQIPTYQVILLMLVIGATNTLDCFIYSKYRVLLQADQKLFMISFIDTIAYIFRILLQAFLIYFKFNIIIVMTIPSIILIFRTIMLSSFCRKLFPKLDKETKPDYSALSKRKDAMYQQIAWLVTCNLDVAILTIFGTLIQVSIYSVYNMIFSQLSSILGIFTNSLLASFGLMIGGKKYKKVKENFDIYEFGFDGILCFLYGVTASMIIPFVSIYTKKQTEIPYIDITLAALFVLNGILRYLREPAMTIVNAAGHFKETKKGALYEALINLIISLTLFKPLGVYGLLIGTSCSNLFRTINLMFYTNKNIFKISNLKSILRGLRTIFCVLISIVIYKFAVGEFILTSWKMWIVYAVISSVITALVIFIFSFITEPKMIKKCIKIIKK